MAFLCEFCATSNEPALRPPPKKELTLDVVALFALFPIVKVQSIQLPLLLKFAIVSPIGVALCFTVAYAIRKIPGAKKIL